MTGAPVDGPPRPAWYTDAACRGDGPAPWYADDPTAARAVCTNCPAALACLRSGWGDPFGIRAGLTAGQRQHARAAGLTPVEALAAAASIPDSPVPDSAVQALDVGQPGPQWCRTCTRPPHGRLRSGLCPACYERARYQRTRGAA